MKFVPVKSEAQQVVLALHRLRAQLMKMRIMQTNEIVASCTSSVS